MITQELAAATPPSREQVAAVLTHTMLGLVYTSPTRHTKEPGTPHHLYS
jgi:hypothetical protein